MCLFNLKVKKITSPGAVFHESVSYLLRPPIAERNRLTYIRVFLTFNNKDDLGGFNKLTGNIYDTK